MIKNEDVILVRLCGGKIELMTKRRSVQICSGKKNSEQLTSIFERRNNNVKLIKLGEGKSEAELWTDKIRDRTVD
jgi:hypothetical protein